MCTTGYTPPNRLHFDHSAASPGMATDLLLNLQLEAAVEVFGPGRQTEAFARTDRRTSGGQGGSAAGSLHTVSRVYLPHAFGNP